MKKWYMLLACFLIMVIAGCTSSDDEVVYGSNDYTSEYIGTLKYVPAGSFQRDATPANISTVSAFRMSEHEITMEQFVNVTRLANPSPEFSDVVNGPVQYVTWYHALVFCNMLSMAEGLTPVYWISLSTDPAQWVASTGGAVPTAPDLNWDLVTANWSANGYRLPTEMEWEWAAMGATSGSGYTSPTYLTGYGKLFAGSDSILADGSGGIHVIDDYVWYDFNSGGSTHTVGEKLPNELGLYDMSGNVFEWCWDWCASYPSGTLTNYRGADWDPDWEVEATYASSAHRVARGGDYYQVNIFLQKVDFRFSILHPVQQAINLGFRVVRN